MMSTDAPSRDISGDPSSIVKELSLRRPKMLITAGPTHEPLDAVRFIANRSSGRLGIALAAEAVDRGWPTTLLLGPTPLECSDTRVSTIRFSSTADLEALLARHAPECDCLLMAAAVADYRPRRNPSASPKVRRHEEGLTLRLESTPDLLAEVARTRQPGQFLVGFALGPHETLLESAKAKLIRKGIDLIVANPLETMDSDSIEAMLIERSAGSKEDARLIDSTPGSISKAEFARWLLDRLSHRLAQARPAGCEKV